MLAARRSREATTVALAERLVGTRERGERVVPAMVAPALSPSLAPLRPIEPRSIDCQSACAACPDKTGPRHGREFLLNCERICSRLAFVSSYSSAARLVCEEAMLP